MYHLMTGVLPFPGSSPLERLGKRISGRHVPIAHHLPDLPPNFVRVIDKLLASKPHERFATAADAADALQGLLKPKPRSVTLVPKSPASTGGASQSAVAKPAAAREPKPQPAEKPSPSVVAARPKYPRWFEPAARFAERRPRAALVSVLVALAFTFGAGLLLGSLLR
jgi:serine/threonine-protein kinase